MAKEPNSGRDLMQALEDEKLLELVFARAHRPEVNLGGI